jgi:hypothetical protein
MQANDRQKAGWGLEDEQPLLKKGVGQGSHQSDVICLTVRWLKDAGQQLEYGGNYEGYWTGELFVKQLKEKIIPAFEAAHNAEEYQVLFMVDNSQGHSAYPADALCVSLMNLNPGGAKPQMHNGWFIINAQKISQPMVFPQDHLTHPNEPKGMKQVLTEHGLWCNGMLMICKNKKDTRDGKCDPKAMDCCATHILSLQPDFLEQKSLVQETIEAAGHLCIFLPKFHCELNFIEFFWGAVKRYLCEHCDHTYEGLKANLLNALESVNLSTIQKWEHWMIQWMDAYREGKGTKEAQIQVNKFSSCVQSSHCRILETVAQVFDKD